MNIAFITPCCLSQDGVGNSIRSLINAISGAGHVMTLYHLDDSNPSIPNCDARYISASDILREAVSREAVSREANSGYPNTSGKDDSHFFNHDLYIFEYVFYSPLIELVITLPEEKVIFHYNGITPPELFPESDPYQIMAREALSYHYLLDSGSTILVHSNYIKNYLETVCPSLQKKIEVLPISVDPFYTIENPKQFDKNSRPLNKNPEPLKKNPQRLNKYNKTSDKSREIQSFIDATSDRKILSLLYVGRLSGNKDIHTLVKAVHWLKNKVSTQKSVKLIIAGAHSRTTTTEYMNVLMALIKTLEVERDIVFISEPDISDLKSLYLSADLFVTASIHEGFCLPVAEALSCKTPCVVANVTATPETMGSGGLTFTASSPEDCGRKILEALAPETYDKLKINAGKEAERFTAAALSKQILKIIDRVNLEGKTDSFSKTPANSLNTLSATANHSLVYSDSIDRMGKGIIKWFRRKVTLPMEASTVRTFSSHQSNMNNAFVEEIRSLKKRLKKIDKTINHND